MTMRVDFCPHCEPTTAGHASGCPHELYFPPAEEGGMEPVNHTTFHVWTVNQKISKSTCIKEDVLYKDHPNFTGMPGITQSPATEKEHATWWAWHKGQEGLER